MRHSLSLRVLALVFLTNVVVFGVGGLFLLRAQVRENDRLDEKRTRDLLYTIRGTIRPEEEVHVAYILKWPYWDTLQDAILVDRNLRAGPTGEILPQGVALNPVGTTRRAADFDFGAALASISRAIETGLPVERVERGQAVPIEGPSGMGVWGGLWYRTEDRLDRAAFLGRMLPWFLLSTLLLTAATFFALRRLVLGPVELLADGARRVRSGDFDVRLRVPDRRDELADLVRSFNDMTSTVQGFNERLADEVRSATDQARRAEAAAMTQRRLAAMGELAAGIAHEINNPLGGLLNAVERIERQDLPPEKRAQYLELLTGGLERIGETVHRLRRFTPRETPHQSVDLGFVTADALELVRHRAQRLGVHVEWAAPPAGSFVVRGSPNELGQAILNLLANALDALEDKGSSDPDGPRIDVVLEAAAGGARLEVRDNGPGVEGEELTRVSDLFYSTKEVGKGTGLGLALVHKAMSSHGGRVRIESELGRFFSVELWLPLAKEAPEA